MTLAAFLLPLFAGWCFLRALLPLSQTGPRWAGVLLEVSLGAGLGAGLASVGYFLLLLLGAGSQGAALVLGFALAGAGAALLYLRRGRIKAEPAVPQRSFRWNWVVVVAAVLAVAILVPALVEVSSIIPYGYWDAWMIWSLRAKYLAGDAESWRTAISPSLRISHPEYPLLLSGFIGMAWRAGGDAPQWTPQAVAFLYGLCALGLVAGAVGWIRSASAAPLAVAVFLTSSSYAFLVTWQYADVPLSLYFAAPLVLLAIASWRERLAGPARLLAGVFVSLAAWTKNEGVPFAAAALFVYLAVEWRRQGRGRALRSWAAVALGSAPVLILAACFRLFLAPPAQAEPFLAQGGEAIVRKLLDGSRYILIGRSVVRTAWEFGQPWAHPVLMLAILAFGLWFARERRLWRAVATGAGSLGLTFLVYCGVYVITPADLAWHLGTSLSRLLAHFWPGVVILAFLALRTVEETAGEDVPPGCATP